MTVKIAPVLEIERLDFILIEDKNADKVFKLTNEDGSDYNLTGKVVKISIYLSGWDQSPTEITGVNDIPNAKVTFTFTAVTHTKDKGDFEYIIEETTGPEYIARGTIIVTPIVSFKGSVGAFLDSELPVNLVLTTTYKTQRITYWRYFLQEAAKVTDANLWDDSKWDVFYNMLIAKLVVHDALLLSTKGGFIQFMGGDFSKEPENLGAPVRSIETGPTKVEFHTVAKALQEVFQEGSSGYSAWDVLQTNLCGLASKIGVKLPMCKRVKSDPIIPKYEQNPDWDYPSLDEYIETTVPSQG